MAFFDLFREFSGSGSGSIKQKEQQREVGDINPMPRTELLLKNDVQFLKTLTEETRRDITVLFLLAHPDDEASHLVYIKMLSELGFPVQVVWLSYGDGSTDIETKKTESTKVLSAVGGIEMKFLPNKVMDIIGDVFQNTDEETTKKTILSLMSQVRGEVKKASVVITNAFEGGHILHDFTHTLVTAVTQSYGKEVLEIPQYSLKTLKNIFSSAIKALLNFQWGSHVFYNVAEFREENEDHTMELKTDAGILSLPSTLHLTNTAVPIKAGLIRQYQSQWEKVFSKLLGVVEFNGSEARESIRKARPIPSLYETLMHVEKIVKSWFGLAVHPKKLYLAKKMIEELVDEDATAENAQQ